MPQPYQIAAEAKENQRDLAAAALYLFRMFARADVERHCFLGQLIIASTYLAEVTGKSHCI